MNRLYPVFILEGNPNIVLVFEYLFDSFSKKKQMGHMFLIVFSISVKVIQLKREANALKNKKKIVKVVKGTGPVESTN